MFHLRRKLLVPIAVVATFAVAFPLGALAAISFSDVPPSHPFYHDIREVADAGVTTGCGGGKYCPDAFVTRGQMAAFMNRLGALEAGKTPVVDADKLDGLDSQDFLKAGPITQQHPGPWTPNANTPTTTVETYSDAVVVRKAAPGTGYAQLPLIAPTSIGGVTYGLSSVKVCTGESFNVKISSSFVWDGRTAIVKDYTDRMPGGCYTVTDPTPTVVLRNQVFILTLDYTAAGSLQLDSTTSTWVPTTTTLVKAPAKDSDTTAP